MKARHYPDTDTLSITLARTPYEGAEGQDTGGPDVLLKFDGGNRVAEVVIEHASRRVDLDEMRRVISFEEVRARPEEVPA